MRAFALVLVTTSCSADLPAAPDCATSSDCADAVCVRGACRSHTTQLVDLDMETKIDAQMHDAGDIPTVRGPCADATAPTPSSLVLNEVLASVPQGAVGDANGDGIRDAYDDEFVELVNVSDEPLALDGVRILVGGKLKHTFEPLCLLPFDAVVVFGGGSIGAAVSGPAVVSDTRLGMANDGGRVDVAGPAGPLAALEYRPADGSLTRAPDLSGGWRSHTEVSATAFSPGTCVSMTAFSAGCPSSNEVGGEDAGAD